MPTDSAATVVAKTLKTLMLVADLILKPWHYFMSSEKL